ncbi:MAG: LamG-like jellyroll fold domain-containing protein [Akkermansiaceae bacterium]
MAKYHIYLGALVGLPFVLNGQLNVDFSSNGTPVAGNPADSTNATYHEAGFESYHARHENAGDFITATYNPTFSSTGAATVMMTPSWSNTTANTVQQSIGRNDTQAASWVGNNVNLLRDWIGCDSRTTQSGNGAWDGTTGTPTYFELTFEGLPAANYEMISYHHDVENMNSEFTLEISTDGGTTFDPPVTGRLTNSLSGGNPAENEVLSGTAPNEAGGDPADLSSTLVFTFTAASQNVVLRFTPLAPGDTGPVHQMFFALNGFQLDQTASLDDTDGDDLPDLWEDEHFGNNDGTADAAELALQDGAGNPDGDGLDNEAEFQNGGDPNNADSDNDELLDHEEVTNGTDLNDPDSDNDTLLDGPEVNDHMTDPNNRDSDGDLFFDQNEVATTPLGPGTASDANLIPISEDGLLIDFSSETSGGQAGIFHDQSRQIYLAQHEVDGSVNRSETYDVPAFGGADVTLTVDFPDTTLNTVKQLIGRGAIGAYEGDDTDLARDWIGVDARILNGGNGFDTPTSVSFTLTGLPAGSYLYRSFHHDIAGQTGDFSVRLTDANNVDVVVDTRSMSASTEGTNPGSGQTLASLSSTFQVIVSSNGIDPVVITYQGTEADDGTGNTNVIESFVGINGFDLISSQDTDGDGLSDEYETTNGLDPLVSDSGNDEDMDDLTNLQEFQIGTMPNKADTDEDGANDGAEVNAGSNPFVQDTDGDEILDGEELENGSDPTSIDSDGDGILDTLDPNPINPSIPSSAERLVAYWPLDQTPNGLITPDLGPNGYNLELNNMTAENFVTDEGRQVAQFDNDFQTMLTRISSPEDDLPITKHLAYTISMWVKIEGAAQNDLRIFSEGSTLSDTPLYNLGTHNQGADGTLDSYIRPNGGPAHEYTFGTPLDNTWRHIAVTGNDHTDTLQVYIDGVLDESNITFRSLVDSGMDTTSLGGILRANPSHWVTGLIDDVALWNKVLSPNEISALAAGASPLGGDFGLKVLDFDSDVSGENLTVTWRTQVGKTYSLLVNNDLEALPAGGEIDDNIIDNGPSDTNPEEGIITYEFENPSPENPKLFFVVTEK